MPLPSRPRTHDVWDWCAYFRELYEFIDHALVHLRGDEIGTLPFYDFKKLPSELRYIKRHAGVLDALLSQYELGAELSLLDRWNIVKNLSYIKAVVEESRAKCQSILLKDHLAQRSGAGRSTLKSIKKQSIENTVDSLYKYGSVVEQIILCFAFPANMDLDEIASKLEKQISNSDKNDLLCKMNSDDKSGKEDNLKTNEIRHPGKLLEDYLIEHDWSVIHAAELLGVTRELLYKIMKGTTGISTFMAKALARNNIGGSALDWLILQAKFDLAQPERPPTPKRRVGRTPKA